jgi:hypothetical protein
VIERVNVKPDGAESVSFPFGSSNFNFLAAPMSADGRYVAIVNLATDLVASPLGSYLSCR